MPIVSASKEDVVKAISESLREIEEVALSLPEEAWSTGVYEMGWNAKQLLSHLAAGGSFAGVTINLAKLSPRRDAGSGIDEDAWNAAQVASREAKSVAELLDELRRNSQQSVAAVEAAAAELLSSHYRAPWGVEGPLADVIIESIEDHVGTHLAELREALG